MTDAGCIGECRTPCGRSETKEANVRNGKAATAAKAMKKAVIAEVSGKLRHDRWKDKASGRWTGKVFIAIDPGEGSVRSKGLAAGAEPAQAAA